MGDGLRHQTDWQALNAAAAPASQANEVSFAAFVEQRFWGAHEQEHVLDSPRHHESLRAHCSDNHAPGSGVCDREHAGVQQSAVDEAAQVDAFNPAPALFHFSLNPDEVRLLYMEEFEVENPSGTGSDKRTQIFPRPPDEDDEVSPAISGRGVMDWTPAPGNAWDHSMTQHPTPEQRAAPATGQRTNEIIAQPAARKLRREQMVSVSKVCDSCGDSEEMFCRSSILMRTVSASYGCHLACRTKLALLKNALPVSQTIRSIFGVCRSASCRKAPHLSAGSRLLGEDKDRCPDSLMDSGVGEAPNAQKASSVETDLSPRFRCDTCDRIERLSLCGRGSRGRRKADDHPFACSSHCLRSLVMKKLGGSERRALTALQSIFSACRDTTQCPFAPHVVLASSLFGTPAPLCPRARRDKLGAALKNAPWIFSTADGYQLTCTHCTRVYTVKKVRQALLADPVPTAFTDDAACTAAVMKTGIPDGLIVKWCTSHYCVRNTRIGHPVRTGSDCYTPDGYVCPQAQRQAHRCRYRDVGHSQIDQI